MCISVVFINYDSLLRFTVAEKNWFKVYFTAHLEIPDF